VTHTHTHTHIYLLELLFLSDTQSSQSFFCRCQMW